MLSLRGIHTGYGRLAVLHGVDFEVASADLRAVIGPNGAGKSTMLRLIFGLLPAWKGSVSFNDDNIGNLSQQALLARGIAYVPQNPSIFPQLSVEDNLEMGLFQLGKNDRRVIDETFQRFDLLAQRRKISAQALSGGERRLLEIARALMVGPRMLLLDEPSLGLSPLMIGIIFKEIRRINADGVTVVLVEQRIKAALTIAKSLSVLRLGRITYTGMPDVAVDPKRLGALLYGASEALNAPNGEVQIYDSDKKQLRHRAGEV